MIPEDKIEEIKKDAKVALIELLSVNASNHTSWESLLKEFDGIFFDEDSNACIAEKFYYDYYSVEGALFIEEMHELLLSEEGEHICKDLFIEEEK